MRSRRDVLKGLAMASLAPLALPARAIAVAEPTTGRASRDKTVAIGTRTVDVRRPLPRRPNERRRRLPPARTCPPRGRAHVRPAVGIELLHVRHRLSRRPDY